MSIESKILALTAAANETSGGNSDTLTDAVQTLVDGYGQSSGSNYYQYATGLTGHFSKLWDYSIRLPENIGIVAPNVVNVSSFIAGRTAAVPYASGCKHLSLRVKDASDAGIRSLAVGLSDLETIALFTDSGETHFDRNALEGLAGLKSFTGVEINANHSYWQYNTVLNPIYSCPALEDFRFKVNSMNQAITYQLGGMPNLSDDTLISIANACVKDVTTGIKLHPAAKARCTDITGTVSAVNDGDVTYDRFTKSEEGSVTLEYFITTSKGVTLS